MGSSREALRHPRAGEEHPFEGSQGAENRLLCVAPTRPEQNYDKCVKFDVHNGAILSTSSLSGTLIFVAVECRFAESVTQRRRGSLARASPMGQRGAKGRETYSGN